MKHWIPFAACIGLEILFVVLGLRNLSDGRPGMCAMAMLIATLFAGAALLAMPEKRSKNGKEDSP